MRCQIDFQIAVVANLVLEIGQSANGLVAWQLPAVILAELGTLLAHDFLHLRQALVKAQALKVGDQMEL